MKDGKPFGIGGLWENWKEPTSGEWLRTFVVITTDANELVAQIHNRMPLILHAKDYTRWLSDEPDRVILELLCMTLHLERKPTGVQAYLDCN